jgi:hypothetical protein
LAAVFVGVGRLFLVLAVGLEVVVIGQSVDGLDVVGVHAGRNVVAQHGDLPEAQALVGLDQDAIPDFDHESAGGEKVHLAVVAEFQSEYLAHELYISRARAGRGRICLLL